jgi:hypothetical protein
MREDTPMAGGFASDQALALQLRIALRRIEPPIWRRLLVPEHLQLSQLHNIFQGAMGWTNSHLHEFDIGGLSYGPMDAEARAMGYPAFDEKRVRLSDFKRRPGITFTYIYDLGDNWEHDVEIEDFVAVVNEDVPKVLEGARKCPPEDVGSVDGYMDFLEAVLDRSHEEHQAMLTWVGGQFDPEAFDLAAANEAVGRAVRSARSSKRRQR